MKFGTKLIIIAISIFTAAKSVAQQAVFDQIDSVIQKATTGFPAGVSVLIAKNGQPVFKKGYGMASIELAVPMSPDKVFRIGSLTKQFTAVAILKLMEEGKLGLADPLSKYIPDYPQGDKITLAHLLSHTSGIKELS